MTTSGVSTFVCDHLKKIHFVMDDGLKLFSWAEINNLRDIFKDNSLGKLVRLFNECEMKHSVMNWELEPLMPIPYKTVYCSAILWLDLVIVRIAEQPIESFFFDLSLDEAGPVALFSQSQEAVGTAAGDENYAKLSSELSSLQRSLQKRNINLEELNERLEGLATTDPLTGLLNRRSFLKRAAFELIRTKRTRQCFCLALFDIDKFTAINEEFGLETGDQCLMELGRMLDISTRTYDGVGRIGRDEFLVYLSLENKKQFRTILKRIQEKIQSIVIDIPPDIKFDLNVSAGGVWLESAKYPNVQIPELLVKVDQVLLYAKEKGDGQVVITDF